MTKRNLLATAAVLALALALPAWAGADGEKKCTESTQVCLDYMASHAKTKGWVGIEMDVDDATGALSITYVEPDSPAKRAGLASGDVLAAMNGIRFSEANKEAMKAAQSKMKVGATITYTIQRNGKELDLPVTLAEIPETVLAKWIGRHMLDHASVDVAQK